jgi:predicted transposase YdaD
MVDQAEGSSQGDPLWDQSPRVRQIRAESEAEGLRKGRVEGRAEGLSLGLTQGEVQTLRRTLASVVKVKFPALADLAEQEAEQINKPAALNMLIQQIVIADDEKLARWLLTSVKK